MINYTILFTQMGATIKVVNALTGLQASYRGVGANVAPILDAFEDREDIVDGLVPQMDGFAAQTAGTVGQLVGVVDRVLADLQTDLNTAGTSSAEILERLAEDMILNGQTVNASTVAAPTVAAVAGNAGTGTLVGSKVDALGRDAEVGVMEVVRFTCTGDRFSNGTAGGETFSVVGWPTADANGPGPYGSGAGSDVRVLNEGGSNFVTNGNFNTFTVPNTPTGWTIGAGAVGTNIYSEATLVHSAGGTALKLAGNSSATTVTMSQNIAASVKPLTRYAAGAFVRKGSGTLAAGSTLAVRVTGTGFSTVNLYTGDPNGLTTSYALKSAFFNTGESVPDDLKIEIAWSTVGGVASTGVVYVDDLAAGPAHVFGGHSYAIFRGDVDFVERDAFTSETAVTDGVIQGFVKRFYGVQLPSNAAAAETIADTLAT